MAVSLKFDGCVAGISPWGQGAGGKRGNVGIELVSARVETLLALSVTSFFFSAGISSGVCLFPAMVMNFVILFFGETGSVGNAVLGIFLRLLASLPQTERVSS